MAATQYIGARYVPMFYNNSDNTADWRPGVVYEPLTIVTYNGNSYTSRKPVPASIGNPSENPEYWASTGIYSEQVEEYRQEVEALAQLFESERKIYTLDLSESKSAAENSAVLTAMEGGKSYWIRKGRYNIEPVSLEQLSDFAIFAEPGAVFVNQGEAGQVLRFYQCSSFMLKNIEVDSNNAYANSFGFEFCENAVIDGCTGRNARRSATEHGGACFAPQRGQKNIRFVHCRGYNSTYGFSMATEANYTTVVDVDKFYGENLNCAYFNTDFAHAPTLGSSATGCYGSFTNSNLRNCGRSETSDLNTGAEGDGTDGGAIILYTANNITVDNIVINNDGYGKIGGIIRGYFCNCVINNIKYFGNAKYAVFYKAPFCILPNTPRDSAVSFCNEIKNIIISSGTTDYMIGIADTQNAALNVCNRVHLVYTANIGQYSDHDFTQTPVNNCKIAAFTRFGQSLIESWNNFTIAGMTETNNNMFW